MVQVNYIGHATVLIDIGQLRVLTDPVLRNRLLFLQRHGWNPAPALLHDDPPDIVLLSHLHHDHADLPSLRSLPRTTTVISPRGSGLYLSRWAGVQVHEVVEGDRIPVADVEITVAPANHGPTYSVPRPARTCLSYILRNSQTVYFAGDTDLFPEMDCVGTEFDLDIALLPVWGFGPRLSKGHLTPLTAAQALIQLQPRVAVPIHWGSLRYAGPHSLWKRAGFLRQPPHTFADHALQLAPQTEVRILQPGQWTAVH